MEPLCIFKNMVLALHVLGRKETLAGGEADLLIWFVCPHRGTFWAVAFGLSWMAHFHFALARSCSKVNQQTMLLFHE